MDTEKVHSGHNSVRERKGQEQMEEQGGRLERENEYADTQYRKHQVRYLRNCL